MSDTVSNEVVPATTNRAVEQMQTLSSGVGIMSTVKGDTVASSPAPFAPPRRPPGAVTPLTRAGSGQTCKRPASTAKPSGATHNNEGVYR